MHLQPPFLTVFYTFWSYDPRRECRLSDAEITAKTVGRGVAPAAKKTFANETAGVNPRPTKTGVQNQKISNFALGKYVFRATLESAFYGSLV